MIRFRGKQLQHFPLSHTLRGSEDRHDIVVVHEPDCLIGQTKLAEIAETLAAKDLTVKVECYKFNCVLKGLCSLHGDH